MSDITIPVTYAGGISYSLIFRPTDTGLTVCRSTDEQWKTVEEVRAKPIEQNSDTMVVEIMGTHQYDLPIYAYMSTTDWETVRRLKP